MVGCAYSVLCCAWVPCILPPLFSPSSIPPFTPSPSFLTLFSSSTCPSPIPHLSLFYPSLVPLLSLTCPSPISLLYLSPIPVGRVRGNPSHYGLFAQPPWRFLRMGVRQLGCRLHPLYVMRFQIVHTSIVDIMTDNCIWTIFLAFYFILIHHIYITLHQWFHFFFFFFYFILFCRLNVVLGLISRYKALSEDEMFGMMNLLDPVLRTANSGTCCTVHTHLILFDFIWLDFIQLK